MTPDYPNYAVNVAAPQTEKRFSFIDGLRACAAISVFAFHITDGLGTLGLLLFGYGWLGVQVFFVLSGFVIAHSVGDAVVTPRYFASFVLRRSLRLEPPYWIVILVTLALIGLSNALISDRNLPVPTFPALLAHLFYLQDLLGYGNIVDVFWSLCLEVQLYLVFVVTVGLIQRLACWWGRSQRGVSQTLAVSFMLLAVLGLAVEHGVVPIPRSWFLANWHEFYLGVLVCWVLRGKVSAGWLFAYFLLLFAAALVPFWSVPIVVVLGTGLLLYVTGLRGWLVSGLSWAPLQFMGRLSYGFYLIHTVVLSRLTRIAVRSGWVSTANYLVVAFAGFVLSLLGAYLLFRFVETPCVRFARRFKLPANEQNGAGLAYLRRNVPIHESIPSEK